MAVRRKTPKRYKHAESVNALFDKISSAATGDLLDGKWLEGQKQAALRGASGWKNSVDAYLHGLAAAGHLSAVELDELHTSAMLCRGEGWEEVVYPLAWTAWVAIVTIAWLAISIDWWFIAALLGMTVAAGAMWARHRECLKPNYLGKQWRWKRPILIGLVTLLTSFATLTITVVVGQMAKTLSMRQFNVDHLALSADPQGFPMLRAFARKNFDVEVVLGDANDSWAATTLDIPKASVASMSLNPGYCELNMYRDNVLRSFTPAGPHNQVLWVQGVMMHEFGHCLDGSRDLPAFGTHAVKVHSIAPADAKGVSDVQTYLAASEKYSTKIWREALADTFAVGYWRLVAPGGAAGLAASLRQLRSSNAAQGDSTHATMCWIDQALRAPTPVSEKDLFAWADHQRSVARCAIEQPSKRISAFMKLKAYVLRLVIADNH